MVISQVMGVITIAIATTFRTSTDQPCRWPSLANADFGDAPLLLWSSKGGFSPPARWGTLDPLELRDLIWLVVTGTMEFCDCPYTLWYINYPNGIYITMV